MKLRGIALAAATLALAACSQGASDAPSGPASSGSYVDAPAVTEPAESGEDTDDALVVEETEEPTPEATAEGDYTFTCDYILDPYKFVATAYITDTGGVPFDAVVKATWKQADGNHITASKRVHVKAGASEKEVYLSKPATTNQIDLIQALPSDKQCKVKVTIQ